jgi:hypothetical protein
MAQTTIYYRLRVRNADDDDNVIVLSSKPGDTNALLCEPPEGDGQTIDPILGTLEVGAYTWQAIDRYDGGDTYTITSLIADGDARNQLLSNKCIGEYQDDGSTWVQFHTGFLNDLKLGDAKTFTLIVGDTDRRERDAVLFKVITDTFDKVSNIIGGPVVADPEVAYQGTPTRAWGPIIDYGPARFIVIGNSGGGSPNPANLVNPTNRVTLSLVGGNLPPRYLGFQGVWNGKIPNPAEYIDQFAYQYYEEDAEGIYATTGAESSQPWGSFPQLEVKLRRVSDSVVFTSFPIAQATKKASSLITFPGGPDGPVGDEQALVANSNDWLIVHWDVATMGAQPALGVQFDGWVRPLVISEDNPLHLRGHPIDLHTDANDDQLIPYDAVSAAAVKAALGPLFYELRITEEWEYSKFTEMLKGSAGYGVRYNADGEQEFFQTRLTQPAAVATVTTAEIIGDDSGAPQEVIFRVSESSAIKGVDYKLLRFRLWNPNIDNPSERPADGVIAKELTISGERRDDSVYGSKIVQFDVPGMIMLSGTEYTTSQPIELRNWIIEAGEVIIDRAGWGWAEGELEVLATVAGAVGDYIDIEAPHQVNAKTAQSPVGQRGGTRKMQIVARTEMPGTAKLKVKDAGNVAQTAPEAGDSGTPVDPCFGLPTTSLSLAESVDNPYTVATVTLDDIADYEEVGADVELQYLVQEATPASTDEGDTFGPLLSSTGDDEIDAPAVLAGETIWVRGRPFISSTGQLCSWSTWISLTLGPDDEGEGGELPAFTLALSIDVDGVLSAEATSTVAEITSVYFLAGAVGGAAPAYADVLLETPDASGPPFTAVALATMEEGETRTVGAIGEDDLGNRTILVLASITRAVDTGAGAGTPGNWSFAFVTEAGGTYVLGEHDAAAEDLETGMYRRTLLPGSYLRGQSTVDVAGAVTAYLDVEYSLDDGATWETDPIGIRVPLKAVKHAVGFATLVPDAAEGDVLLKAIVAGGNGSAVPEIRNFIIESIAGGTPPPLDGEDEPVDPETPGDYPEGGPYGTIIHRWHAGTLIATLADGAPVTSWPDIAGVLPSGDGDGEPDGAVAQASPAFRLTGYDNGLPCVDFDGSNDGLTMQTQMTGNAFSLYLLCKGLTTPAGDYGAILNGNVFPNGKGVLLQSDGQFNVYVNTSVPVPTNQVFADTWTKANTHLYRWVFDQVGNFWFYVDGVQKAHLSDSVLTQVTVATVLRMGAYTGVFPIEMQVAEMVTWNGVHNGATGDPIEAAILAAWGL